MQRAPKLLARVRSGGSGSSLKIIQISWLLFVLSPIQWSSQTKDPIFTCSSAMFHFCMDIRLRLFSSHYMVPCSLGQRTIMNFSSLNYVQAVCPCDQTNFQIEHTFKFRMPARRKKHVLGRASVLHKPARHIHADEHGCDCKADSSNHSWKRLAFFEPHGPWHRFKNQRKGSRKRSRKKKQEKEGSKGRKNGGEKKRKNMKLYELM